MNVSFMEMYRLVRDINNRLSVTNFKRVNVNTEFFRDLEKVFDVIADVISYLPLFEPNKKGNSFIGMFRLVRDINDRLSVSNFKSVDVNTEFFKDLEKVFDDIADVLSYLPMFGTTKKDNG